MDTAGGAGAGDPLIAGTSNPESRFHDLANQLAFSNYLELSQCPDADTLQSLQTAKMPNQIPSLPAQELGANPLPDSPNGSCLDSSSDSAASSKRNDSAVRNPLAMLSGDSLMEDGNSNPIDWTGVVAYNQFGEQGPDFSFTNGHDPGPVDHLFPFGDASDTFMEHAFPFENPPASPAERLSPNTMMICSPEAEQLIPQPSSHTASPTAQRNAPAGSEFGYAQPSISSVASAPQLNSLASHGPSRFANNPKGKQSTTTAQPLPASAPSVRKSGMNAGGGFWPTGTNEAASSAPQQPAGYPVSGDGLSARQRPSQTALSKQPEASYALRPRLRILPAPGKSRVETQLPIKIAMSHMPPGITKLHLPQHTISKPKLLAKPRPERCPDMLELSVSVYCTSALNSPQMVDHAMSRAARLPQGYLPDPDNEGNVSPRDGGEVQICSGCVTRERKRAARKKVKKPDEEEMWQQDEHRRVIVFNTNEIKEWQPYKGIVDVTDEGDPVTPGSLMVVDAPMRIACYCRHHGEKMGFNVVFTVKDFQDRVVAQTMSSPIMITDDHKTHPGTQTSPPAAPDCSAGLSSNAGPSSNAGWSFTVASTSNAFSSKSPPPRQSPAGGKAPAASLPVSRSATELSSTFGRGPATLPSPGAKENATCAPAHASNPGLSRPGSPSTTGPQAKRRKGSGGKVPEELTMTRLHMSPGPTQASGSQASGAQSPFAAQQGTFASLSPATSQDSGRPLSSTRSPTPTRANEQALLHGGPPSSDNGPVAQLYSAPPSHYPSRAPSPNGLMLETESDLSRHRLANSVATSLFAVPGTTYNPVLQTSPHGQVLPSPVIHKIIPSEGPTIGGIEVTVLGASFFQGLDVWFGDHRATTTTFWGESSLVCLLPPSPVSGPVPVKFKNRMTGSGAFPLAKQPPVFKYVQDNEDKLIRTALSVLGHKMSGHMLDVGDLARAILGNDSRGNWDSGAQAGGMQASAGAGLTSQSVHREHLETQLLKCLDLVDLDDSAHRTRLDLKRSTGHTMLHLACSLGYHRFVAALLARGANPDARDNGGFTPLHLSSLYDQPEIVRRLMLAGADPTIRSLSGLRPADVAQSRTVLRAIRRSERHSRSRSGGSLHSRTSSATSLRSLWDPLSKIHVQEDPATSTDSGDESPEYTTDEFDEDTHDSDASDVARVRRSSALRSEDGDPLRVLPRDVEPLEDGIGSPGALAGAFKEQLQQQFQQFQQSMAVHLANLAQMPQMPAFPGRPALPDYQAYLQPPPFMRRVQQWMPGMPRPHSADGQSKMENRWWDLSSYMSQGGTSPPPAYEDIFPEKDAKGMEQKQASAVQAAAEAAADMKCASLYDQDGPATTGDAQVGVSSSSSSEMPSVLKIGPKHAITKEQQEQFLRARAEKLKRLSKDRNLFFIWIPLLVAMICAMIYRYFPVFFSVVYATLRAIVLAGKHKAASLLPGPRADFEMGVGG